MKSPYVSELQANQVTSGVFLVQTKDIRQKRTGEPYLSLTLCDRTGELDAKMWDNAAEVIDTFERDDFVKVRGLLQVHQNRLQFAVHRLQRVPESEVDHSDYFPASQRNPDEMYAEVLGIADAIGNQHLRSLLVAVLTDAEIVPKLKTAPAAKSIHHAFLGGLIEHIVSMCRLAKLVGQHYTDVDMDLLLTGVVLHDIGKVHELSYDRSFGYSSEGQLLGHMIIALRLIGEKLHSIPDFPPKLRTLVEHMIISHHGALEYGSPKVPLFAEALLLHHLDNLDAKMDGVRSCLERDRHVDGCWTGYISSLERPLLKKARYLEDAAPEGESAPKKRSVAEEPAAAMVGVTATQVDGGVAHQPAAKPAPAKPVSSFAGKLADAWTRKDQ